VHHVLSIDDLHLPARLSGEPRPVDGGYLLPPGDVALLHPFGDAEFYRHGWNSWSPTGWRRLSDEPLRIYSGPERRLTADDAANDNPARHRGSGVGALAADGRALLLGALGTGTPIVEADRFALTGWAEDPSAPWFLAYGDELEVFSRYAEQLAAALGRRAGRAPRVWSTWYSFYEDIDAAAVRQAVEEVAPYPLDVFQVDDGWERTVGDWTPNVRFPDGMAAVADDIHGHDLRAGLWLSPLIAMPDSEVARDHPDWLLRDAAGAPLVAGYNWGTAYHALDTTRTDVRDHLRRTIERVVGWGFDYLKLDFMYAGALRGVRSVDQPREEAYRDALHLIREAAGDDVYLLGSGVPVLASLGILDGMRVGPDVAPYWDNTERDRDPSGAAAYNALVCSVHRAWLGSVVNTDPDAVYFRSRQNLLDAPARAALVDLAIALGFRSTSDRISALDASERAAMTEFFRSECRVAQVGRHRFRLGEREVDFAEWVNPGGRVTDRLLMK